MRSREKGPNRIVPSMAPCRCVKERARWGQALRDQVFNVNKWLKKKVVGSRAIV